MLKYNKTKERITIKEYEMLLNIILAGVCGFIIGFERKKRSKEAGIRTHTIVAVGSALIMSISISIGTDPGRIAAQIVSGIGFLGAGMIFFRRESLRGLTTAAGIWATAGIGMAAGCGMYVLCIGTTILVFLVQMVLHSQIKIFRTKKTLLLSVKFIYTVETVEMIKSFFDIEFFTRFKIYESENRHELKAEAVIHTDKICDAHVLAALIRDNDSILMFERLEDL